MKTTIKLAVHVFIMALLLGALLGMAITWLFPFPAHADEGTFINGLDRYGVEVTTASLELGHAICYRIGADGVAGFDVINEAAQHAGLSTHDTSVIVVQAIYELCPSNRPALNSYLYGNPNGRVA